MECGKCINFKQLKDNEYTCKYLKSDEVGFMGDSNSTAECCDYYKETKQVRSKNEMENKYCKGLC